MACHTNPPPAKKGGFREDQRRIFPFEFFPLCRFVRNSDPSEPVWYGTICYAMPNNLSMVGTERIDERSEDSKYEHEHEREKINFLGIR